MNQRHIWSIALAVLLVLVTASVLYTNRLAGQLAIEEHKKMEIWADATERLIQADEDTDIDFVSSIIEGNTTIPVYITDSMGHIITSRNARRDVEDPRELNGPIRVEISDELTQYIYYDESNLLRQLHYFPYIQGMLIIVFLLLAIITLYISQRSEQNRVWVGLSKETAHQLGTPISSLNAWQELLKMRYPDDDLIPQMQRDVDRLQVIADRFSKVGSKPELQSTDLYPVLRRSMDYMCARTSNKVKYDLDYLQLSPAPVRAVSGMPVRVMLNVPLFEWVLENLMRNAVDAMEGQGNIHLLVTEQVDEVWIDVTDTGKGIERRNQRQVFRPGFTTKKRGWGLGLSLSKRIVEDYHRGKIFVQNSVVGKGTTFRIVLKKAKDC